MPDYISGSSDTDTSEINSNAPDNTNPASAGPEASPAVSGESTHTGSIGGISTGFGSQSQKASSGYIRMSAKEGWIIYRPKAAGGGYRYGPSMILEDNKVIHVWFSATGNSEQWDWIKYRRSTDGGRTWTDDKAVLKPTADSEDAFAACDPGVVKVGNYYYIGYTATTNMNGVDNHIFLGRSKNPSGPYEKWNGSGWGGLNPKPVIRFNGTKGQFGAGEPSFTVVNNTIYMYYTWFDKKAYTRVATAPAGDPDWPAKLTFRKQIERENTSEDSWDVKYVEDYHLFISTSIVDRMKSTPSVVVRQSADGINFTTTQHLKENIAEYAHNGGISGRGDGHIRLGDQNYYGYAYGSADSWGAWCTLISPVTFSLTGKPYMGSDEDNRTYPFATSNYTGTEKMTDLSAKVCLFRLSAQSEPAEIQMIAFTSFDRSVDLTRDPGLSYSGYDTAIIRVSDHKIIPLKNGSTQITVTYKGLTETIRVKIGDYWSVRVSCNEYFWDKQYLIDNNPTTVFSTTAGRKTEWIELSKPSAQTVKGLCLVPRAGGENFTSGFYVEASLDGINWKTVLSQPEYTNPRNNNPVSILFPTPVKATHIRLTSLKHGEYFQLAELTPIQ